MAPQQLEKIESGPGNGMGSEAANPQDVVHGRAADRARLRLASRENDKIAKGQKKGTRGISPGVRDIVAALAERGRRRAPHFPSSTKRNPRGQRPRLQLKSPVRRRAKPRVSSLCGGSAASWSDQPPTGRLRPAPGRSGRRGGKFSWLQSLEKPQNRAIFSARADGRLGLPPRPQSVSASPIGAACFAACAIAASAACPPGWMRPADMISFAASSGVIGSSMMSLVGTKK